MTNTLVERLDLGKEAWPDGQNQCCSSNEVNVNNNKTTQKVIPFSDISDDVLSSPPPKRCATKRCYTERAENCNVNDDDDDKNVQVKTKTQMRCLLCRRELGDDEKIVEEPTCECKIKCTKQHIIDDYSHNNNNNNNNHYHCNLKRKTTQKRDLVNEKNSSKRYGKMCNLIHMIKNLRKSQLVVMLLLLVNSMQLIQCAGGIEEQLQQHQQNLTKNATNASLTDQSLGPGVCRSMDIRNRAENLENLEGCRVIEGFLQILLIDDRNVTTNKSINDYSFPLLQEVTDFVLFFRVKNLRSLRKLFPNLSLIRGDNTFNDCAFVIYEMFGLEEIGLTNLIAISNGMVRIEKNPNLCFADSIDWSKIANNTTKKDHLLEGNRNPNECAVCKRETSRGDICPEARLETGREKYLCWGVDDCQKVCPSECPGSCFNSTQCCPPQCLGGCEYLNGAFECTACRNLVEYRDGGTHCSSSCAPGLFELNKRRCITSTDCQNRPRPLAAGSTYLPFPYISFNGAGYNECIMDCPVGYSAVTSCKDTASDLDYQSTCRKHCEKCKGACEKYCMGKKIDNGQVARELKGCTVIDGYLEIVIRKGGNNIVRDLEESLKDIKRITKYLKISHSYPVVSLSFFKSLEQIDGSTDPKVPSLSITLNQNIQDLFGSTKKKIKILRGTISFRHNPKLCAKTIQEFKKTLDKDITYEDEDAMLNSNGDKSICEAENMTVSIVGVQDTFAVFNWQRPKFEDKRVLYGYLFFYIEAPQNVTLYDGRDACGGDGWEINDVAASDSPAEAVSNLKPDTRYAYYVRTVLITTDLPGAQSEIAYFRTKCGVPEQISKLTLSTNSSSELDIIWGPPKSFNGEPDEYEITLNLTEDKNIINIRDYCLSGVKESDSYTKKDINGGKNKWTGKAGGDDDGKGVCESCTAERCTQLFGITKTTSTRVFNEDSAITAISFEDKIHDWVYVKNETPPPNTRRRRSIFDFDANVLSQDGNVSTTTVAPTVVLDTNNSLEVEERDENNKIIYKRMKTNLTSLKISDLKHFGLYTVAVRACRKHDEISDGKVGAPPPPGAKARCGMESIEHHRTVRLVHADDIVYVTADTEPTNSSSYAAIRVGWRAPEDPNGVVVSYSIRYTRDGVAKVKPQCITAKDFENGKRNHVIPVGEPGNYSIEVMATSIAGDGRWSKPVFVVIPQNTTSLWIILLIVVVVVVLIVAGVLGSIFYVKTKYPPPPPNMRLIASVNAEYVSLQYTPDEWEVPREKVIQLQELGQGSFGMVYEGILKDKDFPGHEIRCAIKTVNEAATDRERINFLQEASVMKGFDTHHVVKLLGVVSSGQPTLVVMELMTKGDLKEFLRKRRPENQVDVPPEERLPVPEKQEIYRMSIEILDGMAHLAFKKFVHRDLAARNCMVAEDNTVKIGDFGMTRDIYETDYYRKGSRGLLPVRWMAPESLKDGVFSSASDVFSFGIVLYEMATLASQPYQGLSNDQVLRYVMDGGVMEKPENCPDPFYDLMSRCWVLRPTARPTFMDLIEEFLTYVEEDYRVRFKKVSFYHSTDGQRYLEESRRNPHVDELVLPDDDDANNFNDGDNFLANQAANSQLLRQNEMPIVRASQALSSGIASNFYPYRIDEETDDADMQSHSDETAEIPITRSPVPGTSRSSDPNFNSNGSAMGGHHHVVHPGSKIGNSSSSNNSNSSGGSSNNAVVSQHSPASVAINLSAPMATPTTMNALLNSKETPTTSAGFTAHQQQNNSSRLSFLKPFFNTTSSTPNRSGNNYRHHDVEDPLHEDDEDADDHHDHDDDDGGMMFRLTKTPKKPTDKKTTDEELRPLSNGFVVS